jgi:hypothetical protein
VVQTPAVSLIYAEGVDAAVLPMRALLIAAALALVLAPLAAADDGDDPRPPPRPCRPMCIDLHPPSLDPDDPGGPCRPSCLPALE